MAVWSKVDGVITKHAERKPMLAAAIRVSVACSMSGIRPEDCAIYRRDPTTHPDEPNVLPELAEKANRAKTRKAKR